MSKFWDKVTKVQNGIGTCALIVLLLILALAASWGFTAFIVWLITLCFGWEFNFLYATGVWLILWLLGGGIKINTGK